MSDEPIDLSLAHLRARGHTAADATFLPPGMMVRRRALPFADLLAFGKKEGVLAVVSAPLVGVGAVLEKVRAAEGLAAWLASGNRCVVHGWTTQRGKRVLKEFKVRAADLGAAARPARRPGPGNLW